MAIDFAKYVNSGRAAEVASAAVAQAVAEAKGLELDTAAGQVQGTLKMISPFHVHRDKVLGGYSTANWLRGVVMALWKGDAHPVSLSRVGGTDAAHFEAFLDMVAHYREHGENDLAFYRLVLEIQQQMQEESAAEEHAAQLNAWRIDVARELVRIGKSKELLNDHYQWFENQFKRGAAPTTTASDCAFPD